MSFHMAHFRKVASISTWIFCSISGIGVLAAAPPSSAGVFEELVDGTISPLADVAGGTDTAKQEIYDNAVELALAPRGAVIFDSPVGISFGLKSDLILPKPKSMGWNLSPEQRRMHRMAAEIALSYSRRPGVVRARLDQATFVSLFTTMIRRESNFNPRAVSRAGAKGLGQLMPNTARELGVCDVFSPRENLEGAAVYLTAMMAQFGSPEIALAAYNAGPAAVTRHRGIPPFKETRQYVADIMHATRTPAGMLREMSLEALAYEATATMRGGRITAALDKPADPPKAAPGCMKLRTGGVIANE